MKGEKMHSLLEHPELTPLQREYLEGEVSKHTTSWWQLFMAFFIVIPLTGLYLKVFGVELPSTANNLLSFIIWSLLVLDVIGVFLAGITLTFDWLAVASQEVPHEYMVDKLVLERNDWGYCVLYFVTTSLKIAYILGLGMAGWPGVAMASVLLLGIHKIAICCFRWTTFSYFLDYEPEDSNMV